MKKIKGENIKRISFFSGYIDESQTNWKVKVLMNDGKILPEEKGDYLNYSDFDKTGQRKIRDYVSNNFGD